MAKAAPKAGKGPCPHCAAPVWFRTSAGGMLKFKCEGCDATGFAEPGGRAFKAWAASITEKPDHEPTPASEPAAAPTAPTAPAARKPAPDSSAFNMRL